MSTMDESPVDTGRIRSFVLGLKGGAIATIVMTAFRMPISHSLPPTANFWAHYIGSGDADSYPIIAVILHVMYGVVGGGFYGMLFSRTDSETRAGIELSDLVRGAGYSLALSLFGSRMILQRMIEMDLERDEALIFHVGHLIYGLTLGTWIGSNR